MNLSEIQEAIRVAVRDSLGFSDTNTSGRAANRVVWARSKEAGGARSTPRVDLLLKSNAIIGLDETRHEFDSDADELTPSLCGVRALRVEVRIESDNQRPGEEESVGGLAARMRTRLYQRGILSALSLSGVALNDVGRTEEREFKREARSVSVSVTEVLFSAAENDIDTSAGSGDYIARTTVRSYSGADPTLLGESGSPTETQVSTVIPPE